MLSPRLPRSWNVFAAALVLLAAISAWWLIFLTRHVSAEHALRQENLRLAAQVHARVIGRMGATAGPLREDPRFEVGPPMRARLEAPAGRGLAVRPTAATLVAEQERFDRRRLMVLGEGTLLLLTVAACALGLLRLASAERRRLSDVLAFVGRVTGEVSAPLAELRAALLLLRDPTLSQERRAEIARGGLRAAEREEHLVDALLTAHRLRIGVATAPEALDLARALEDFTTHRRGTLEGSDLVVDCGSDLRAVATSAGLHAILEGLLDEADARGARTVRLAAEARGRRIRLHVQHDGVEDERPPSMGLSIAESLAREMRATLERTPDGYVLDLARG